MNGLNYAENESKDLGYTMDGVRVYLFSNLFMYLTFAIALVWCDPKQEI